MHALEHQTDLQHTFKKFNKLKFIKIIVGGFRIFLTIKSAAVLENMNFKYSFRFGAGGHTRTDFAILRP
jgi:hypothetical protein